MKLSDYSLLSPRDIIALRGTEFAKVLFVIGARYVAAVSLVYLALTPPTDKDFWFWAIVAGLLAYELALILVGIGLVLWAAVSLYDAFQNDPTRVMLGVIMVTVIMILVVLLRRE